MVRSQNLLVRSKNLRSRMPAAQPTVQESSRRWTKQMTTLESNMQRYRALAPKFAEALVRLLLILRPGEHRDSLVYHIPSWHSAVNTATQVIPNLRFGRLHQSEYSEFAHVAVAWRENPRYKLDVYVYNHKVHLQLPIFGSHVILEVDRSKKRFYDILVDDFKGIHDYNIPRLPPRQLPNALALMLRRAIVARLEARNFKRDVTMTNFMEPGVRGLMRTLKNGTRYMTSHALERAGIPRENRWYLRQKHALRILRTKRRPRTTPL